MFACSHATLPRLASALACLGLSPAALAAPSVDQALRPIATTRATYQAICARVVPACDAETVSLYEDRKGQTGWRYYLLSKQRPQVWMSRERDFDQADHWTYQPLADAEKVEGLSWRLYPGLFRTGEGEGAGWAWTVVSKMLEKHADGGGQYRVVDFVAFDWPRQKNSPQRVLYSAVPFDCIKMQRACFTSQAYENSRQTRTRCYEETSALLRIQQARPATANDPGWQFVWHESHKPAFESQTHETRQVLPIALLNKDEQATAATQIAERHRATRRAALMCGGSQE